jgi:hypothetical protein
MLAAAPEATAQTQTTTTAAAQTPTTATPAAPGAEWDTVVIHTGALVAQLGSDIRVDPQIGNFGTSISLEDVLGFKTSATTFFIDGTWRISRRNQLQVRFDQINRSVSDELLNRDITFGDSTFNVGAQIDSFFNTSYISADYGFAFIANPQVELGAMIGLTALRIHTGMSLTTNVGNQPSGSRQLNEDIQFTAPVPLPGVFVNIRPHPRVTINGYARYLKVTVGDFSGGMTDARAGADVKLVPWLGIGGSYYYNRVAADHTGGVFRGRVEYTINGPEIYAMLAF